LPAILTPEVIVIAPTVMDAPINGRYASADPGRSRVFDFST